MPRKLIRILERKTHVEWTSDDVGQELFWEKLNKALKDEIHHEPFDIELASVAPTDDDDVNQDRQLLMA